MRLFSALLLAVLGALLLVIGLGFILYLPPGRDTQNRLIAIGVALLVSGALAIVTGARMQRPPFALSTEGERSTARGGERRIVKYFLCAGALAGIAWATIALTMAGALVEVENTEVFISFIAGLPFLIAALFAGAGSLNTAEQLVAAAGVCFVYFGLGTVPLAKANGWLRTNSSRQKLWTVQWFLIVIHALFGLALIQILKD